jgi:YD repeat-containing protein
MTPATLQSGRFPVSAAPLGLICATLASACSGAVPSGSSATDDCLEVRTWLDSSTRQETRATWDPALRILTKETRSTPAAPQSVTATLKWRYAAEGRIIALVGIEQPFQHDYDYDDHDNVVQFRLSYPGTADVLTPSTAPTWIGTTYENQYSPAGRLAASTITSFGDGAGAPPVRHHTYTEDDAGRCWRIESPDTDLPYLETRTYDDPGRLVQIDLMQAPLAERTTIAYDDQDRIVSRAVTDAGTFHPGTVMTTYSYPADGSQVVTVDDGVTDIASDAHTTLTRTAACLAIDAAVGAPADQRCRLP